MPDQAVAETAGLSRRRMLALLGGGGAAVAAGLLGASAAAAMPEVPTRRGGWADRRPCGPVFDLSANAATLMRAEPLHNKTVLQSFAFDNLQRRVYTLQLMQGGLQLPGEGAPVAGATRDLHGDLCLTELDWSGNELGSMYLTGFGHGVQMGVEESARGCQLWTETAAFADDGLHGWGTRLARFQFQDGAVLTPDSVQQIVPVPGADRTTAAIDPLYRTLTVRHRVAGTFHYAFFDLDRAARGELTPYVTVEQPDVLEADFQGYTSFGDQLYLLEGNAYGAGTSVAPIGNTVITRVDVRTGQVRERQPMSADSDLLYREPEGMAIALPNRYGAAGARLSFGFASTVSSTDTTKQATISYLDRLR